MDRTIETLQLFGSLTVSLLLLFIPIAVGISLMQRALGPERLQRWLGGARLPVALAKGTALGAITPFCGCSTVPLLVGLIKARVRFAAVAAFMLASPLLNPYILGVVGLLFGVRATIVYASFAVAATVVSALLWERFGLDLHLRGPLGEIAAAARLERLAPAGSAAPGHARADEFVGVASGVVESGVVGSGVASSGGAQAGASCSAAATDADTGGGGTCGLDPAGSADAGTDDEGWRGWRTELPAALGDARELLRPMVKPLLIGMSIGALIYGAAPQDLLAGLLGTGTWWSLPLAALLGLPLYLRGEAAFPIGAGLLAAGVGEGPMLAMVIAGMSASLPEVSLLSGIFDRVLLGWFLATVFTMAILGGALIPLLW
ncbi:MAG: permease [Nitriliruptoraceae bacterium]|nr:permease [Nitriliruptoraceae bacterium]